MKIEEKLGKKFYNKNVALAKGAKIYGIIKNHNKYFFPNVVQKAFTIIIIIIVCIYSQD